MLVELNKTAFQSRIQTIYQGWRNAAQNEELSSIDGVDALLLVAGDPAPEDEPARKGTAIQQWLLGYEFPSTLILFAEDKITILCSASKDAFSPPAKILSQIQGSSATVPVEIIAQAKSKEPTNDAFPRFFSLYASKKRVGSLPKEAHRGKLIDEWKKALADAQEKPEVVEMSPAFSAFMAVKDEEELKCLQLASVLTSTLLKHYVADKLESILDKESKISHELLAAQIEARLGTGEGDNAKPPDAKVWSKGKGLSDIDWPLVEFCYPPIIISRSSSTGYDLRYTAESSADNISHKGVLLVAFGLRYKSYCANVGRTFIVDPTPEQEAQYNLLLSLQQELLSKIKHGISAQSAYEAALAFVKEKNPELEKHFQKNIGFVTGIEFRDSAYLLNSKNGKVLKENMVISLGLGFTDLVDASGKKYALQLVDTIKVESSKSTLLTDGTRSVKDTMFFLTPEDEVEEKPRKKAPTVPRSPVKKTAGGKVLRNQPRRTQDEVHQSAAAKLAEHQREIHRELQTRGLAKFSEEGAAQEGKEGKGWKKFQSYKGEGGLPPEVERLRIFVDRKGQSVILPINGFAVPFHINTIKNASKNDEGEYTYLRVNFQTPGQLAGKKEDTPFEDPDATFVRSVVFRSPDNHRFDNIYKQITELKKEANKREQQKKEMADVIEQDNLIEVKARRPAKLPEAFIRPALDGKRLAGEVEIHQNGVRYLSPNGQKVDVLFSNVKHLFFQPCDHELLAIIHFHLKAPIMIGKKKTHDVQFVREATDAQFDETGNRKRKHRYGDEDEIEQEHQERKRRQALNNEMQSFSKKISDAAGTSGGDPLEVDLPYRDLSFEGVPHRTSVRLQPTTECLVHLTDPPFLVVTLSEIEIASLERVQYNLKQFDLCFIMKDFTKPPLHINSIQSGQMDDVKIWLDSVDIPMTESPVNFNWGPIMKTINEDPHGFFQNGGWTFLGRGNGADSDHSDDGSETESEFEADSEEMKEVESTDDESAYGNSGGSDESGSDFGGGSDESEGEDWDELERKAAKSDLKRAEGLKKTGSDDSDSDRPKKKKASKPNGKPNGKVKGKR
ncbi:FACT complex subunit SPT16 [Mycena indigotica]|uniref:FACT complex subunit n=1 Tax=Mycena indigotica TaxID=2126181 RepID=A0A8H6VX94_9AGAR|nr:FACT complex subunit SPT16 [Mycena indigotica]KAF7295261.1 FACT complex subunit SPT16 [Mycena indigotica]